MIHQHFKLVEVFTAMDNIILGTREKLLPRKALKERIREISRSFGLEIDPEKKIYDMSVSEKQTVEIIKVLYRGARILILDEPTAVLTPQETEKLFEILRLGISMSFVPEDRLGMGLVASMGLMLGYNPITIYGTNLQGAFRSKMAVQGTVKVMIPLLIASLGVMLAFKMRFWNIGAEGQIINWVLVAVMFLAGVVGGGLWGLIPAWFKTKYNTNETLFTLMLNYIALNIIVFLREGPWRDSPPRALQRLPGSTRTRLWLFLRHGIRARPSTVPLFSVCSAS